MLLNREKVTTKLVLQWKNKTINLNVCQTGLYQHVMFFLSSYIPRLSLSSKNNDVKAIIDWTELFIPVHLQQSLTLMALMVLAC